jgi:hypothetical protein
MDRFENLNVENFKRSIEWWFQRYFIRMKFCHKLSPRERFKIELCGYDTSMDACVQTWHKISDCHSEFLIEIYMASFLPYWYLKVILHPPPIDLATREFFLLLILHLHRLHRVMGVSSLLQTLSASHHDALLLAARVTHCSCPNTALELSVLTYIIHDNGTMN